MLLKTKMLQGHWVGLSRYTKILVVKGFTLGKMLGKKLQIRGEENHIKYIRKTSGKIERRLLGDIGCGIEGIFNRVRIEKYNKLRLHISVDSSGSMQTPKKWCPTMTCVVAICVAASMVENLWDPCRSRRQYTVKPIQVNYHILCWYTTPKLTRFPKFDTFSHISVPMGNARKDWLLSRLRKNLSSVKGQLNRRLLLEYFRW